jgi:N-methylhydantoinase B/oxoprolinase/acetone carboxylase alpha subunit
LIEEYRLLPDSGGPGEFRGGLGGERLLTVMSDVTVSALLNRMKADPWGILDGGNGARGGIWVKRAGESDWRTFVEAFGTMSPSKFSGIRLQAGDQVRLVMPGGGGYGDPRRRDRTSVARDITEGFITAERAWIDYGYGQ